MIIRVLLIAAFFLLIAYVLKNRKTSRIKAGKKLAIFAFFLFAISVVIHPQFSNYLANKVGVGRGADLLLYLLTVSFIAYALNQYFHSQDDARKITKLARRIAILEANQNNHNVALLKSVSKDK